MVRTGFIQHLLQQGRAPSTNWTQILKTKGRRPYKGWGVLKKDTEGCRGGGGPCDRAPGCVSRRIPGGETVCYFSGGGGGWAVAMGLLRLALTPCGDWELERAVPPRGHFTVFVLKSLKKPFGWYFTFQRSERRFIIASFPKCLKTGFKGLSLGFGWKEE